MHSAQAKWRLYSRAKTVMASCPHDEELEWMGEELTG
jgi:hypothetical protein